MASPEDSPRGLAQRTCHCFSPSCFWSVLRAPKTNHFPVNRVTVRQSALGFTCMRNGDYHGAIIEADLALRIACALPPPFLLWLVGYCTFSTPSCSNDHTWARMSAREWNSMATVMVTQNGAFAHASCGRQAADKIFLHLAFDQAHGSPGISYFGEV